MDRLTTEQVEAELQQIKAEQEALDHEVNEGTMTGVEHVRRAAALDIRLTELRARVEEHVVAATAIPNFPPAD